MWEMELSCLFGVGFGKILTHVDKREFGKLPFRKVDYLQRWYMRKRNYVCVCVCGCGCVREREWEWNKCCIWIVTRGGKRRNPTSWVIHLQGSRLRLRRRRRQHRYPASASQTHWPIKKTSSFVFIWCENAKWSFHLDIKLSNHETMGWFQHWRQSFLE